MSESFRYPSSGPLLQLAFDWLAADRTLDSASDRKALDRIADETNSTGVSAERRAHLIEKLVEGLLGEKDTAVTAAITDYLHEWDSLAADLNSGSVKPETHGLRLYPLIRLVCFDLAIRAAVGTFLQQPRNSESGLVVPAFDPAWLDRDAVTRVLKKHHAGSWEALAGSENSRPVQLIFRWRTGESKPSDNSLRQLANDLESAAHPAAQIERELRVAIVVREAFSRLDELLGTEGVDELACAVRSIATKALQALALHGPLSPETLRTMLIQGPRQPAMRGLIELLTAATKHPGVKRDLNQLSLKWAPRIRWWLQVLGDPAELKPRLEHQVPAGLTFSQLIDGARRLRMSIGDPFEESAPDPRFAEAMAALEADPKFQANRLQGLAGEAKAAGNLTRAIQLYTEAARLDPQNVSHLYALGATWGECAGPVAAANAHKFLGAALAIAPDHSRVRVELGIVLCDEGRHAEAEVEFERAAPLEPDWSHLHYARGVNAAARGDLKFAETCLRRSLQLDPARDDVRASLVVVLERDHRGNSLECRELRRGLDKRLPNLWRQRVPRRMRPQPS